LLYGVEPLFPFDITDQTWYALEWDKVRTSEELLALRMRQIARRDEDIIAASKKSLISRTKSAAYFFEKHKNRIVTGNYEPGTLVLVYNEYLDNQFGKKGLPRWNGPFVVIQKRPSGAFVLAELDGSVWRKPVAASRVKLFHTRKIIDPIIHPRWETMREESIRDYEILTEPEEELSENSEGIESNAVRVSKRKDVYCPTGIPHPWQLRGDELSEYWRKLNEDIRSGEQARRLQRNEPSAWEKAVEEWAEEDRQFWDFSWDFRNYDAEEMPRYITRPHNARLWNYQRGDGKWLVGLGELIERDDMEIIGLGQARIETFSVVATQDVEERPTELSQEAEKVDSMENDLMDLAQDMSSMNLVKRTWFEREELDCEDHYDMGGIVYIVNERMWKKEVDEWTKSTSIDMKGDCRNTARIEWSERKGLIEWDQRAKEAELPVDVGGNSEKDSTIDSEIRQRSSQMIYKVDDKEIYENTAGCKSENNCQLPGASQGCALEFDSNDDVVDSLMETRFLWLPRVASPKLGSGKFSEHPGFISLSLAVDWRENSSSPATKSLSTSERRRTSNMTERYLEMPDANYPHGPTPPAYGRAPHNNSHRNHYGPQSNPSQSHHDNSRRPPPSAPSGPTRTPSSTQYASESSPNFVTEILEEIRSLRYDINGLRSDIRKVEDTSRMTEKSSKSTHRQVGELQKSTSDSIEDLRKWNGNLSDGMSSVESAISSLKKFITTDSRTANSLETSFFALTQDMKSVLSHMSVEDESFATINDYWGAMRVTFLETMKLDDHEQNRVDRSLREIQDLVDEKKRARLQRRLDEEKKGKGSGKSKEIAITSRAATQVVSASQPAIDEDDDLSDAPPDPVAEKETTPPSSLGVIPTTTMSNRSLSEEVDYSNSPIISSARLESKEKEFVAEKKIIVSKGTKRARASPPVDSSAKSAKKGYGVKRGEAVKSK
jgi:hypothetical protein